MIVAVFSSFVDFLDCAAYYEYQKFFKGRFQFRKCPESHLISSPYNHYNIMMRNYLGMTNEFGHPPLPQTAADFISECPFANLVKLLGESLRVSILEQGLDILLWYKTCLRRRGCSHQM